MPGMYFIRPIMYEGKLQAWWTCDKCHKHFAFENGEMLFCPKCKERGYPINLDPDTEKKFSSGESGLIVKP